MEYIKDANDMIKYAINRSGNQKEIYDRNNILLGIIRGGMTYDRNGVLVSRSEDVTALVGGL